MTAKRDPKIAKRIRRGEPATAVASRYGLTPRHVRRIAAAAGAPPATAGRKPTGAATHHTARGRALLARLVEISAARGVEPEALLDGLGADRVVRLTGVQVDRLAAFEGETTREQLDTVLAIAERHRAAGRKEE